jgi:DNA-binding GntR family transcriptional regulator
VPHAAAADLDDLEELAAQMVDLGDRDLDGLVPLNRAFHGRLGELAAAPALATALAGAVHSPLVARNFHAYDAASLRRSLAHHVEIVAALRAGDPEWARAVMTAHIHNARAVMVAAAARTV